MPDERHRPRLAHLPTPLEEAPRLSAALGARILIKRDDLTGLALGGNKARKLEYLVGDAIAKGCDTLVTAGGAQSNHARMTAAAAAQLNMACHLVLGGIEPGEFTGNLLLDRLFGAQIHFTGTDDWTVWQREVKRVAAGLGPAAYAIPIGGSTPVGALGYVQAADELMWQMPDAPDWIVVASSSGGTQAGLLAGLPPSVRVLGIDVARPDPPLSETVPKLAARTAQLAGRTLPAYEWHLVDHTGERYAAITQECRDAVRLAAETEGLILDPVYSGKAMAGLIAAVRANRIGGTIVFWHTGGAPTLFAEEFASFFGEWGTPKFTEITEHTRRLGMAQRIRASPPHVHDRSIGRSYHRAYAQYVVFVRHVFSFRSFRLLRDQHRSMQSVEAERGLRQHRTDGRASQSGA